MAPIKFEENIKEKLDKRTIVPSSQAWETLSQRLDSKDKKQPKSIFWWIGMAASVVGILFMYNILATNKITATENIVDVENKIDIIKTKKVTKKEAVLPKDSIKEVIVDNADKTQSETRKTSVERSKKANNYLVSNTPLNHKMKEAKSIEHNTINKLSNESNNAHYASNYTNKNLKVLDKSTTTTTQQIRIEITDGELDLLLKQAESKIAKTKPKNNVPLDYNGLLQDVEDDLEESFRDKLLRTVKGSYHTVKSYVAERND